MIGTRSGWDEGIERGLIGRVGERVLRFFGCVLRAMCAIEMIFRYVTD